MAKLTMTRRSFIKAAAVAGAAAALLSSAAPMQGLAEEEEASSTSGATMKFRSGCRSCGKMECGSWVTLQDGKVVKVEGDETAMASMGNCCSKSQASLQQAYHPARNHYPMKRTNAKDEGPAAWERISWDEAVETIAEKVKELKEKYTAGCIFSIGGTSRIWCMGSYGGLGGIIGHSDTFNACEICKHPRWMTTGYTTNTAQSFMETVARPRCYVQWGGASELSNYDDSCRTTVDAAVKCDIQILTDPRQSSMGKEAGRRYRQDKSGFWCNIFPGTDSACALAWAQVIIENDLVDQNFARKWTNMPMLICDDLPGTKTTGHNATIMGQNRSNDSGYTITRMLKEADIKEGGEQGRLMVVDELYGTGKGSGAKHTYDNLVYYDVNTRMWEHQTVVPEELDRSYTDTQPNLYLAMHSQVMEESQFDFTTGDQYGKGKDDFYPALVTGGVEVTLKDGTKTTCYTVYEHLVEMLQDWTPEKATEICHVEPDVLREAALAYATRIDPSSGYGNGGIQYMLAIEHGGNCIQNVRSIDLCVTLTGNQDIPGGQRNTCAWPWSAEMIGTSCAERCDDSYSSLGGHALGYEDFPFWHSDGNPGYGDACCITRALNGDGPRQLHMGIQEAGDILSMSNPLATWNGGKQLDFFVSWDLWQTVNAGLADILLPAAHWLEITSPRKSQGASGHCGLTRKAITPPGEALFDGEGMSKLAKALGLAYAAGDNPWPDTRLEAESDYSYMSNPCQDYILDSSVSAQGVTWAEYEERVENTGWIDCKEYINWLYCRRFDNTTRSHTLYGDVGPRGINCGFTTNTGKVEIWSTVMENAYYQFDYEAGFLPKETIEQFADGLWIETEYLGQYDLPGYIPSPRSIRAWKKEDSSCGVGQTFGNKNIDDEMVALNDEYPLTLTTGRRQPTYFHSEHRQIPFLREQWTVPRLEINPVTAEKYGIEQGDWVKVTTNCGTVYLVADLFYGVKEDVVNAEHSWWYPELERAGKGIELSAINNLTDVKRQDRHIGTTNARAYPVQIEKSSCPDDDLIVSPDDQRLKDWMPVYEGRI